MPNHRKILCNTLLRIRPADAAPAWCALGVALASLGDRTGALVALRHALARDAAHVASQLALGKLLFDCGEVEHALRCFERAAEDSVTWRGHPAHGRMP
jgi:tetratricopeptide (TPR) repeat protein